jgi:CRP-like cAMP-binding protein
VPKRPEEIDILSLLRKVPYFADLESGALRRLAGLSRVRNYRKDEVILWEGEPCEGLHVVLRGRVKVFKRSEEGREQVLLVIGPGRSFNDVPVFDGGANPGSVAALDPCTIAMLPKPEVLRLAERHPAMAMAVIRILAARMRGLTVVVVDLALRTVTARVAKVLMESAGGRASLIETPAESGVRLTQSQLAAMTGTVREVVQRALKTLEHHGAIKLARGRITVLDATALKRWAEGHEDS